MDEAHTIEIRPMLPEDREPAIKLLVSSLGWEDDDAHRALFTWKHDHNHFGPSPGWVAVDDGRLAGVRLFLRWEFEALGRRYRAVRAVDTATDPAHRGRGIFRRLTLGAVEAMQDEGVDFVFNTPNDQSRPGYLKMGWEVVGRLPISVRPRGVRGLARLAAARVPADLWSQPCDAGVDPAEALADDEAVMSLLASVSKGDRLRTPRSPGFLRWRYGLPDLRYRFITGSRGVADGFVALRLRRRGPALEAAIADVVAPGDDRRVRRKLVAAAVRASGADYGVWLGSDTPGGLVPLPRQGPVLTWRALAHERRPDRRGWDLRLGDIELF